MGEPPDDLRFLCSSSNRVNVLHALQSSPCDRHDLQDRTDASQPTVSRILSDFEERHWVTRESRSYRLTPLGSMVAAELSDFVDTMTTEQHLRDVWSFLPHEVEGFSIDLFGDIVVSHPAPSYPYQPLDRLTTLFTESSVMKGFGMAVLKSANLEPFFHQIHRGLDCEYIYPPSVFDELLSWNREVVLESIARENYTVYVHDDLPIDDRCGICLFDDRTSICCYDPPSRQLRSLIDTGGSAMHDWAESYYQRLRADGRLVTEDDELLTA